MIVSTRLPEAEIRAPSVRPGPGMSDVVESVPDIRDTVKCEGSLRSRVDDGVQS